MHRGVHYAVLTALLSVRVHSDMGALMTDTRALNSANGGCINAPGDSNSICSDIGSLPAATACSSACDARSDCSAMTWHGPTTGEWAMHCVLRLDGVWEPLACGAGCDHTAANKTSGWVPYSLPWAPSSSNQSLLRTFWFGANATGLDAPSTLSLMAAHSVAGYGWQQGGGRQLGTGEQSLAAAATHVNDYLSSMGNPNQTVVFVYRQIQVALRLFAQSALAADDPANDAFWYHDTATGALCTAGQPWGTSDPYWNFTDAGATQYWLDAVVKELTNEPALTAGNGAVFFDEVDQGFCGYRAGTCDFSQYAAQNVALQSSSIAMLASMVKQLNAAGIVPILSLDNRMAASGGGLPGAPAPCAVSEDALVAALRNTTWVRFYENWPQSFWVPNGADLAAAMISNAILEGQAGVPVVLHSAAQCPAPARVISRPGPLGGDVEYYIAAYLIVATPGATISLSSGWYDDNFCWRPDYDVVYGTPIGPATRTGNHTWTRNYTMSWATIDVQAGTGMVFLL